MGDNSLLIDKALVELLKQGDIQAFEKVFFSFADRLYYFAIRYMRNQHDAEEIVQEVFVKLWENRANLNDQLSFSGYQIGRASCRERV